VPTTFIFDKIYNLSIIVISNLDYPIFISQLCTGILEFCLLVSAIFATKEVILKKRIIWMLWSILLVVVFNIIRIVVTILFIVFFSVSLANIFHSFLFRLFLVIIVVGFYYLFLKIMVKQKYFITKHVKK
jgi:exosortase/archaeosortase family protein